MKRASIGLPVAGFLFIVVAALIGPGRIDFTQYLTVFASFLTVTAFSILYWTFKPQIDGCNPTEAKAPNSKVQGHEIKQGSRPNY
ncbi:MAG: hypothetical protein OK457_07800 [Thaumarchaeota archaeon]|nr:hypothetical protein [Nitrososphaerota archaeon]